MRIKLVIKKGLFIFSLLLIGATSFSQLAYTFERLNTESGLPTNTIKGLQFDEKNRFVWIATESGIVRYNGHDIQSFGESEQSKILDGRIVFFDKTHNGNLYGKLIDESVFVINKNKAQLTKNRLKLKGQKDYLNYKYGLIYLGICIVSGIITTKTATVTP